jgi:GTPase SAR1 family protein
MAEKKEHKVPMSLDELKTAVLMMLPGGTTLSRPQEIVLQGTWEGKTFRALADEHEYDFDYLRTIASHLWAELSIHYGQTIGKKNLLTVIENESASTELTQEISTICYGTPAVTNGFCGRETELADLREQLSSKRCIIVWGADGVGKTSLISKLFSSIEGEQNLFNLQGWLYSEGKNLENDIEQFFRIVRKTRTLSATKSFVEFLKYGKSVIFIDEVDSWLKDDCEVAKNLIREIVQLDHNSCVVLSVKNPFLFGQELQDNGRLIYNYKLNGLSVSEARLLFKNNGINGPVDDLINAYRGIPKFLLYACKTIKFIGSIEDFKKDKTLYLTESDRIKLETIFSTEVPVLSKKEQTILFFIYKNIKNDTIMLKRLIDMIEQETEYKSPLIYTGLRTLERQSIITILDSKDSPDVLLHREVRGYLNENPKLLSSLSKK